MKIVTPLDVYRSLAPRYRRLAFIAANAQGLAGIERVLLAANPALDTLSAAALTVVLAIEQGEDPDQLVEHHHLAELADWFAACGMEALLLGCTHFPFAKQAIQEILGPQAKVYDGAIGAAAEVKRQLASRDELNASSQPGQILFENSAPAGADLSKRLYALYRQKQ